LIELDFEFAGWRKESVRVGYCQRGVSRWQDITGRARTQNEKNREPGFAVFWSGRARRCEED
jgi:hypothetical protein